MVTAERRYYEAMKKSALLANRAARRFVAGEIEWIDGDFDRKCIIKALQRAYEAGRNDAPPRRATDFIHEN